MRDLRSRLILYESFPVRDIQIYPLIYADSPLLKRYLQFRTLVQSRDVCAPTLHKILSQKPDALVDQTGENEQSGFGPASRQGPCRIGPGRCASRSVVCCNHCRARARRHRLRLACRHSFEI